MKIVLNRNWGGFSLPQDFCDAYDLGDAWGSRFDIERDDPRLIKWVEDHADRKDKCGDLVIVKIPDSCTDWEIDDYDGMESIVYVVDGKLRHA